MVTKITITDLGKKSWVVLNWIETENRSIGYATPASLKLYARKHKRISVKELREVMLPALVDANLINIEG